jgi:nucleotide-binding universal stress UspA family protein
LDFKSIQKILIPTDGSDYSMRAAEYGISIAKMLEVPVVALFVIDEVVLDQITNDAILDQLSKITKRDNLEQELKHDGERHVRYVKSLAEKEGVKCVSFIAKGRPFEQIVHLVKDSNVDLIVMGTYGLTGADRILLGSVAERVIEYSPCPVLVIK